MESHDVVGCIFCHLALDDGFSCYAIPRGDFVVLGGTHEEGQWDQTPDAEVSARILDQVQAGPDERLLPRYQSRFRPSFIELNGSL